MLVAADAQAETTFQAAPLQNLAAVCGGHALAETVHTHAPPDLWLISTLGHYQTPIIRIKTPNGGSSAGVLVDGWQL
jgi:hypothetical protein